MSNRLITILILNLFQHTILNIIFKFKLQKNPMKKIRNTVFFLLMFFLALTMILVIIFRFLPVPTSSFIVQKRISDIFQDNTQPVSYDWTNYENISPSIKLAVIAAEDQKFPEHFGFDFDSIEKALSQNEKRKIKRGASTITQQTAKNLFLWSDKSFIRKGLEVYFTLLLEIFWSKERILEVYLNIAEFGENIYGVKAASKKYFNVNTSKLSFRNAAQLAAVLPNPKRYKVNSPSPYVQRRTIWIQRQMNQLGQEILEKL
ncbi:MAG: monofunctional biosynthetic peptidoglycan transglycosylase [Ignavibacteriales bacterium]|nr:monofunctional biosynthetic peptidoglycan transglycosylase [Ignavibacteriales bacterium]MCB9218975.1 monofunctional biosynthetic peptidoglycan transglycosylase [Ignavibacteriales bacterium]